MGGRRALDDRTVEAIYFVLGIHRMLIVKQLAVIHITIKIHKNGSTKTFTVSVLGRINPAIQLVAILGR